MPTYFFLNLRIPLIVVSGISGVQFLLTVLNDECASYQDLLTQEKEEGSNPANCQSLILVKRLETAVQNYQPKRKRKKGQDQPNSGWCQLPQLD